MGIPISGDGICKELRSWWTQASPHNAMGIIKLILPCLLCWENWREQNRRGTFFNLRSLGHADASIIELCLPFLQKTNSPYFSFLESNSLETFRV